MHPEAKELLNHLFAGISGYLELTMIAPPGVEITGPRIFSESYLLGQQRPSWEHLAALNAQGFGIYYGLTAKHKAITRGRSHENNARWLTCFWVDIDLKDGAYADKDAIFNALTDFHPIPTAIIDSGGGMHGLWRVEPFAVTPDNLPMLKGILRGLALHLKGDPACAELARIFRLPGTTNTKPERNGARCELAAGDMSIWPRRYPLERFAPFALSAPTLPTLTREFIRHKPGDQPGYIGWYLTSVHLEGTRNNALNWTAYKMRSDGYSQADAESALTPRAQADGLDENEIKRTIQSAFAAAPSVPSYVGKTMKTRMLAAQVAMNAQGGVG